MNQEKSRTCCFTGHRNLLKGSEEALRHRLEAEITSCIEKGYNRFLAGGATGFDTMAAESVLLLKERHPEIMLILALPYPEQAKNFDTESQAKYEEIKERADAVVYTASEYKKGCLYLRDRYLVDNSALCICHLRKKSGGTAYTVAYAKEQGLTIVNIL